MTSPQLVPPVDRPSSATEKRLFRLKDGTWLQTSQKGQAIEVSEFTPPFKIQECQHPNVELARLLSGAAEVTIRAIGPRFTNRPIPDPQGPSVGAKEAGISILRLLENMASAQVQSAGLAPRIIPRTCLRRFYSFLRDFPQSEVHRPLANYVAQPDGTAALDCLFDRSVQRSAGYANEESFHGERHNAWRPKADAHAESEKRKAVALVTQIGNLRTKGQFSVFSAPENNLNFMAVSYEVSPLRTTKTRYEDGTSGKPSGAGGMDLLLRSADGGLPILGEVKAPGDTSLFAALIQALTYASELATDNQHKRLVTSYSEAFRDPDPVPPFCDIYILYFAADDPALKEEAMKIADLLMAIPNGEVAHRVRRIAFIETSHASEVPSFTCRRVSQSNRA
jgi:hypothetical protein